jgi:hypothetical protein
MRYLGSTIWPRLLLPLGLTSMSCASSRDMSSAKPNSHEQERDAESGVIAEEASGSVETAPGTDLTFVMRGHVNAGGEVQNCLSIKLPTDRGTIAVHSAESHYTAGSHHLLVYRAGPQDLAPELAVEHLCSAREEAGNLDPTYYEAQAPDSSRKLPPGVAHVFEPGEVLLLTSHYLNTTDHDLDTQVTFVLHTVPSEEVEQEAGSIFFYNPSIAIPPGSSLTARRNCPITQDINLALLWSHMHARGVAFKASTDDPEVGTTQGTLYESEEWSEPTPRQFPTDPPITVHAGSSITYACRYENRTEATIKQGLSAVTNEMCILHGMYWPRVDQQTEQCFMGVSTSDDAGPLQ